MGNILLQNPSIVIFKITLLNSEKPFHKRTLTRLLIAEKLESCVSHSTMAEGFLVDIFCYSMLTSGTGKAARRRRTNLWNRSSCDADLQWDNYEVVTSIYQEPEVAYVE